MTSGNPAATDATGILHPFFLRAWTAFVIILGYTQIAPTVSFSNPSCSCILDETGYFAYSHNLYCIFV